MPSRVRSTIDSERPRATMQLSSTLEVNLGECAAAAAAAGEETLLKDRHASAEVVAELEVPQRRAALIRSAGKGAGRLDASTTTATAWAETQRRARLMTTALTAWLDVTTGNISRRARNFHALSPLLRSTVKRNKN